MGLERSARLVAVALIPVFLATEPVEGFTPLYTALIAYVLATSFTPRNRFLRAGDVVVAGALIVATGGQALPFLLFLMVAVAGPAARGGVLAGLAAGATLAVVLTVALAMPTPEGGIDLSAVLPIGLLLPLTGVTTGAAARVHAEDGGHDRRMLQEANRLLSALRAIADDLPGGLDVRTVAAAMVAEARHVVTGSPTVLVFALGDGVLRPVATDGVSPGSLPPLRIDQVRALAPPGRTHLRSLSTLPEPLAAACSEHRWWTFTGMFCEEEPVGLLLLGVDDADAARVTRPRLASLASDGAVALQNARLFDGTRERAAHNARVHLADDLHDGVAQALAHLRMELELLSLASPDHDGGELGRLARVATTALEDLRSTITGLQRPSTGDVGKAISRHIDYLTNPSGPRLEFEQLGDVSVRADATEEILRILSEALSNALRHAQATRIRVLLESDTELLRLLIEDDGAGLRQRTDAPGNGIGIRSMHERAARLGGHLEIGAREGGGTSVELRIPHPTDDTPSRPLARGGRGRAPNAHEHRRGPQHRSLEP